MLKSVFGSLLGKLGLTALLLVGASGGMAATGAIPGLGMLSGSSVAPPAPLTGTSAPGVNLDFPSTVLEQHAVEAAPIEPQIIEEVVVVPAARTVTRQVTAAPSAPVAPKCVADLTAAVNAVAGAVPAVASAEQGHALLAYGNNLIPAVTTCVTEGQQAGFAAIDSVLAPVVNQLGTALAQIQALPVVASAPQTGQAPNVVGGVIEGVGTVVGGTLNMVGKGLGYLGTGLNFLTGAAR
ncbi:MAG TPA: hypothetical protein VHL54_11745 [Actinomycetota bacterium]|nr:hypothetical protein [Actinomycetota bacterium]